MVEDMDFNSLLIQQVKQYPVLYDNTSVNYKDNFKKAQAWTSVSDEVGDSVVTCQQRWKILRERYVREKKLLDMPWTSSNFCHTVTKHPWPHMDQMCFLSSYIKHRNRSQQWLLDRQDLIRERHHDLQILTEEEYQRLFIFFSNLIQALGEQLKVRQQVIATATVYFKRFYARNSLKCIDPLLLAPTCIFLASKVEEFGVISNSRLITTCQSVIKNKFSYAYTQEFPYRINHVLECEFFLLEMMDCCLVLYQPYRPLMQYVSDLGHEDSLLPLAWRIVNDSLRTDVCLLYPPYQIALACLHMACVIQHKDAKQWFAELNVDMQKILEITRQLLGLYELWKNFDEKKEIQALLAKMPKPKVQPPRPSSQGVIHGSNNSTDSSNSQSQTGGGLSRG